MSFQNPVLEISFGILEISEHLLLNFVLALLHSVGLAIETYHIQNINGLMTKDMLR
jgi:hypothetical protein